MKKLKRFIKPDPVLCAAFILAVLSAFFVHPDAAYADYIDWRSLGILWGLMVIIQGLRENAVFEKLAIRLLKCVKSAGGISCVLVFLCFFGSMFITNDVALITFVPFAILLLHSCGRTDLTPWVVILQTLAANLGSMLTPVGNPQNLYLYGAGGMSVGAFLLIMLPYSVLTAALLLIGIFLLPRRKEIAQIHGNALTVGRFGSRRQILIYAALFALMLLSVFRILPWQAAAAIVLILVGGMDYKILARADYILLLTFICFFIFTGNIGRIPQIHTLLARLVSGREFYAALLSSQVISNVPAALLLHDFAADQKELLIGVNVGGLGTLIASMASLISYKNYANAFPEDKGKYLLRFTALNLLMLLFMIALHALLA